MRSKPSNYSYLLHRGRDNYYIPSLPSLHLPSQPGVWGIAGKRRDNERERLIQGIPTSFSTSFSPTAIIYLFFPIGRNISSILLFLAGYSARVGFGISHARLCRVGRWRMADGYKPEPEAWRKWGKNSGKFEYLDGMSKRELSFLPCGKH